MGNMGLDNQLLADALTDYITVHGTNKIGIIAYQLGTLLSTLENDATYSAAAKAWNAEVTAAYEYSANPINTTPSTVTTEGNEEKKKAGQEAGAKAWVVKPFQPAQMLAAVSKLLMM